MTTDDSNNESTTQKMNIYLLQDGQQIGPYSVEEIRARLRNCMLTPDDLAWKEGLEEWVAVGSLMPALPPSLSPPIEANAAPESSSAKTGIWAYVIGGFIFILFLLQFIGGLTESFPATRSFTQKSSSGNSKPKLLLLNSTWQESRYGAHAITEGEIQNISSESLKNVVAVVNFYTAEKQFITSDEVLIALNPILPGQTSPFKSITTYNPAMNNVSITFKEIMGGTIPMKKSTEKMESKKINSVEAARQYIVGPWTTTAPGAIGEKWVFRDDGTMEVYRALPASDNWREPFHCDHANGDR